MVTVTFAQKGLGTIVLNGNNRNRYWNNFLQLACAGFVGKSLAISIAQKETK